MIFGCQCIHIYWFLESATHFWNPAKDYTTPFSTLTLCLIRVHVIVGALWVGMFTRCHAVGVA